MFAAIRGRAITRTAVVGAVATAGLVVFALPAFAHVTITPDSLPAGSTAELTFHVPNEESNADTVKVDVQIPTAHPIAQFLVKPVPGWTATVKTVKLAKPLVTDDGSFSQAVSEVIWSGGKIAPGQFQDFSVSVDPLPTGVASLTFKAIQTYSDGNVVRWIDVSQPGQPEPEHPAPVLTLTTGTAAAGAPGSSGAASSGAGGAAPAASASAGSDGTARGIAIGGVLIGLFGLSLGVLSWRRTRTLAVPAAPGLDGDGLAMAATAKDHQNDTESRRAGTPPRDASRRKSGSNRTTRR